MADIKSKITNLINLARAEGISDEKIRGYLTFTKTAIGEDKDIMNRLYKENDIWMSEIVNYEDMEAILNDVMGKTTIENNNENQEHSLSEKSKQLMEKVELLTQKIEQEKNPFKKHILAFQVRMLIAKIQREIDLNNIRANYETKRDKLKNLKEERESQGIDNIAELDDQIKNLRAEIAGNEEYDVDSPEFIYPKAFVENLGGTEVLVNKLKESKKVESQQAAKRIEVISQKRKQIMELEEKLAQEQEDLKYSEEDYINDIKAYNKEEKSLILKERLNVFSRIGLFFSNMIEEVKLYREERKQNKELDAKLKEEENLINEEYRKKIEELKEEQRKAKENLREEKNKEKEEKQVQQGVDRATQFRTQMSEMTKEEESIPESEIPETQEQQSVKLNEQEETTQESEEER